MSIDRQSPSRLRVLFIPQWYPSADGSDRVTGTFCREHARAASLYDDVAVLVFGGRPDRWPTLRWNVVHDDGIPTFYARYGMSPIPKTTRFVFHLQLRRAYSRVVAQWGSPDVIHTQDEYAYYVMKTLAPFRIPFVISQHWSGFMERLVDRAALRRFRWSFEHTARVLPANRFAEDDYAHYGLRPPVSWLPNALDTAVFAPPDRQARKPFVLHVSGFTPEKRFPDILAAFALVRQQVPDASLQVVGNGPKRVEMEGLASRLLPAGAVHFHGQLDKARLANMMREARGLAMASNAETFGCVLMEAMACGCPVLTTRVGGIPAVVRDGDGIFVDVGDIPQIAAGMERLLKGTHGLNTERISRETRARFSHATIGQLLHDEHVLAVKGKIGAQHSRKAAGEAHLVDRGML